MSDISAIDLWNLSAAIGGKMVLSPWCVDKYNMPGRRNADGGFVANLSRVDGDRWQCCCSDNILEGVLSGSIVDVKNAVDRILEDRGYILA